MASLCALMAFVVPMYRSPAGNARRTLVVGITLLLVISTTFEECLLLTLIAWNSKSLLMLLI